MSLGTILIIILILVLLGVIPTWGHSRAWGHGPSGIVGLILIVVIILALLGRLEATRRNSCECATFTLLALKFESSEKFERSKIRVGSPRA
jgi:hypothetical protein